MPNLNECDIDHDDFYDHDDNEDFDNYDNDGLYIGSRILFADPGGNSALRAGPRVHPCPTCGRPDMLSAEDVALSYQCDVCADNTERFGGPYGM